LFHPEKEERDLHICTEKFIEKGPDGGDGGRGGHVYLVGNKGLWTLFHLKFARHIKLDMERVVETRSTGADGEDKFIVARNCCEIKKLEILFEITENGEK
jgi:GTP-binding protein